MGNYAKANWEDLRIMGIVRKSRQLGFNPVTVSNKDEIVERQCGSQTVEIKVRKAHVTLGAKIVLDEQGRDKRVLFPSDDMTPHYLEHKEQNSIIQAKHARIKQRAKRKRRRLRKKAA